MASTTVVSARTRFVFNTRASTARASNASFKPSTATWPQRVVIFINVVGCGTRPPSGIRQNRCQPIESVTSRHNDSNPSRYRNFKNINRRYVSIGIDGRPNVAWKNSRIRRKEPLVVQQSIHPLPLGGHHQRLHRQQRLPQRRLIAYRPQHRWLRSVLALRVGAIIPDQTPRSTDPTARSPGLFQVEVASGTAWLWQEVGGASAAFEEQSELDRRLDGLVARAAGTPGDTD